MCAAEKRIILPTEVYQHDVRRRFIYDACRSEAGSATRQKQNSCLRLNIYFKALSLAHWIPGFIFIRKAKTLCFSDGKQTLQ
jgi:hypothetical protein